MRNTSSTWDEYGAYELSTYLESRVGYDGDGLYGFDGLSLGWTGDGLPTVDNQSIAGIISPNFTLGSLALSPRPVNFTNYNNPIPSFMQNLRTMDVPIPSLSWSYTAGAYNLAPKVFGSLILGGYDSTRFEPNNIIFPFGADISLDFQVAIQRITVEKDNSNLLSTPIIAYISTLIPDIWLPTSVCEAFLSAFELTYSNETQAFYINRTQHEQNLAENPTVDWLVGPETKGSSVTIRMPYWNFYLAATEADTNAIITEGGFRFPIRRAAVDTQYILGRAFLQSAYLSADYDRNTFNLSQAAYPSSSKQANVVAILPPGLSSPDSGNSNSATTPRSGPSTAAIAGIAAGGVVLLAVIIAVVLLLRRKKKVKQAKAHELEDTDVQRNMKQELSGDEKRHEVGAPLKHEMPGDSNHKVELYALNEKRVTTLRGHALVQIIT
jgi:hypothetical protein